MHTLDDDSSMGSGRSKGDRSLRASGKTYCDRSEESKILTDRIIHNHAASVTGIAGPRGSGKSSLALKVLDKCRRYSLFTQLIHSPTGYDPKEFLVSVFQALCEGIIASTDRESGQEVSLYERGTREKRRLQAYVFFMMALAALIASVPSFVSHLLGMVVLPTGIRDWAPLLSIVTVAILATIIYLTFRRNVWRQIGFARKSPLKAGLRQLALELSEHLQFQTTLSSSAETGIQFSQITSKLSAGKSLASRPLSLPSLTGQLERFLKQMTAAYPKGIVICLDELDKIEDPKDLDKLLRGIKGVLGVENTHFILTVSEDALVRFTRQRRFARGMMESAFEDIISLERIGLHIADHMVDVMYPESDRPADEGGGVPLSTRLLWMFGGGIPREIKRNALVCLEARLPPKGSAPLDVWKLLFRARLDDMYSWVSRVGTDNQITYRFIHCLRESMSLLDQEPKFDLECGRRIVAIWMKDFGPELSGPTNGGRTRDDLSLDFGRSVVEILVSASALVYVMEDQPEELCHQSIEQLDGVFRFTPTNLAFAGDRLKEYLSGLGLLG